MEKQEKVSAVPVFFQDHFLGEIFCFPTVLAICFKPSFMLDDGAHRFCFQYVAEEGNWQ